MKDHDIESDREEKDLFERFKKLQHLPGFEKMLDEFEQQQTKSKKKNRPISSKTSIMSTSKGK